MLRKRMAEIEGPASTVNDFDPARNPALPDHAGRGGGERLAIPERADHTPVRPRRDRHPERVRGHERDGEAANLERSRANDLSSRSGGGTMTC